LPQFSPPCGGSFWEYVIFSPFARLSSPQSVVRCLRPLSLECLALRVFRSTRAPFSTFCVPPHLAAPQPLASPPCFSGGPSKSPMQQSLSFQFLAGSNLPPPLSRTYPPRSFSVLPLGQFGNVPALAICFFCLLLQDPWAIHLPPGQYPGGR